MPLLRGIYGRRSHFGSLTMSWACGIICGADTMYEAEGFQEVDRALKKLFRDEIRPPAVPYYDTAYGYKEFLRKRKDRFWVGTQLVVDSTPPTPSPCHAKRIHIKTHVGLMCAKFNNPNHQDNPLLWHTGEDGNPAPNFDSSIAESNNAWLSA
ncbi:unnamed protein product, partial [Ectocarpus sp. 12 AP-2014]